jgi:hypothetical protein
MQRRMLSHDRQGDLGVLCDARSESKRAELIRAQLALRGNGFTKIAADHKAKRLIPAPRAQNRKSSAGRRALSRYRSVVLAATLGSDEGWVPKQIVRRFRGRPLGFAWLRGAASASGGRRPSLPKRLDHCRPFMANRMLGSGHSNGGRAEHERKPKGDL